jgi:hypothetical protein
MRCCGLGLEEFEDEFGEEDVCAINDDAASTSMQPKSFFDTAHLQKRTTDRTMRSMVSQMAKRIRDICWTFRAWPKGDERHVPSVRNDGPLDALQ